MAMQMKLGRRRTQDEDKKAIKVVFLKSFSTFYGNMEMRLVYGNGVLCLLGIFFATFGILKNIYVYTAERKECVFLHKKINREI